MITIKGITDEDFVNYKKPSMFIAFPTCNWKCGMRVCQNSTLAKSKNFIVSIDSVIDRYIKNKITKAIVFGGLEPFDSWEELIKFVAKLRKKVDDDIVIYTGYNEDEVEEKIKYLCQYPNIIIKFGRFIPNDKPHYDEILGIELASNNQYARRIS